MAEIINLRTERKRAKRREAEHAADENRRAHGMSKADREVVKATKRAHENHASGHKLEKPQG